MTAYASRLTEDPAMAEGTQYRLVGTGAEVYAGAQTVQPSLEDGYIWLMKSQGQAVELSTVAEG